jgi:ubiquinone/menaquinone biosynthesis C-methylase UbiE
MNRHRSFDHLAHCYRPLEYLAFGRDLERARFVHLERLRNCHSILVLGEGDGRCLARLVQVAPQARIDCLDGSSTMLACAFRRISDGEATNRVTFRQADLLTHALPAAQYDAVITFFFLDCFTAAQADALIVRIQQSLRPGALWLWADFALPARGYRRLRARAWLALLYAYFRWQTGLSAHELPPMESLFAAHDCIVLAEHSFQQGLLRSIVWQSFPAV